MAYFLILPCHYIRNMAFYPSSMPEGNHANPTHTYFSFSDWSTLWNETTKNSTEYHTDPHNTKLEGYRHLHLCGPLQHPHIPSIKM